MSIKILMVMVFKVPASEMGRVSCQWVVEKTPWEGRRQRAGLLSVFSHLQGEDIFRVWGRVSKEEGKRERSKKARAPESSAS